MVKEIPALPKPPKGAPLLGTRHTRFSCVFKVKAERRRSEQLLHTFLFPTLHYQGGREFPQAKTSPFLLGGPLRASVYETLGDKDHETE